MASVERPGNVTNSDLEARNIILEHALRDELEWLQGYLAKNDLAVRILSDELDVRRAWIERNLAAARKAKGKEV